MEYTPKLVITANPTLRKIAQLNDPRNKDESKSICHSTVGHWTLARQERNTFLLARLETEFLKIC
jgi:hypothetical protein